MRFFSIASGSKGNCVCAVSGSTAILIDAGVAAKTVKSALSSAGIEFDSVKGIFLTHEHTDHIKRLSCVASALHAPVFANMNTVNAVCNKGNYSKGCSFYELPTGKEAELGEISVVSFKSSHDAAESVGYIISDGKEKIAVCTDTGRVTKDIADAIYGAKLVYIESNHDEKMLVEGDYPPILKDRILSSRGHLSNCECGCSCRTLLEGGAEHFILAHLSEENNTPRLALETVSGILAAGGAKVGNDCSIEAAGQYAPSKIYEI